MPVRRSADPISVQHVWDAIRFINIQRQMADLPRIVRYLQRIDNCTQAQAELYIKQCIDDGLLTAIQKLSSKSTTVGEQVESYKIPVQENVTVDDGKDWYCIECHLAGDVILCRSCFRVFHEECGSNNREKQNILQNGFNIYNETKLNRRVSLISNNIQKIEIKTENDDDCITINNNTNNGDSKSESDVDLLSEVSSSRSEYLTKQTLADNLIYDNTLCSICNLSNSEVNFIEDKKELNHLLSFILHRIRSWVPENITSTMSSDYKLEWHTESELSWRAKQLFYEHMDMNIMDLKIRTEEYNRLSEFQADVLTVQHNIAVFHGIESQEYGAAELMLRDCIYDITELKNCRDCYKYSNEKINNKWFCLPCRIPHKLVWAKQKGYPYWPAKVMKETDNNCDVRFFGGKYERSLIPKNCIKPISFNLQNLQLKKTAAFNKAFEELRLHQKLLDSPEELNKFITDKKNRKPSIKKNNINNSNVSTDTAKKKKSLDKPKDVYEFHDSPLDQESNFPFEQTKGNKRKRTSSPFINGKKKNDENIKINSPQRSTNILKTSYDVINISDIEDSDDFNQDEVEDCTFGKSFDSSHELVSSSTEFVRSAEENFRENSDNSMQQLEQPYNDAVEKMRRKLEQCKGKKELMKVAMDNMQYEIDRITNDHNDHLKKLFEAHSAQISETKKKQWCYNCEQDAIYHCCWNTAYCSQACQQQHWQAEHKKVCRRKR